MKKIKPNKKLILCKGCDFVVICKKGIKQIKLCKGEIKNESVQNR